MNLGTTGIDGTAYWPEWVKKPDDECRICGWTRISHEGPPDNEHPNGFELLLTTRGHMLGCRRAFSHAHVDPTCCHDMCWCRLEMPRRREAVLATRRKYV